MKAIFIGGDKDRETHEVKGDLPTSFHALEPDANKAPDDPVRTYTTYILRCFYMSEELIHFYCPPDMTDAQVMHRVLGVYVKKKG